MFSARNAARPRDVFMLTLVMAIVLAWLPPLLPVAVVRAVSEPPTPISSTPQKTPKNSTSSTSKQTSASSSKPATTPKRPQPRNAFAANNLVVVQVGDGSKNLGNSAAPVFLDEFSSASPTVSATQVQTISLPTASSGSTHILTLAGSANLEGSLNRSVDGAYLTLAGYEAASNTNNVASTSNINHTIARVDYNGNIDTSNQVNDGFDGQSIRSAVTDYGLQFWVGGNNVSSNGLIRYLLGGASTSTALITAQDNLRNLTIFNGQLYASSNSTNNKGVNTVGSGLPTTSGQTMTLLPGLSGFNSAASYVFFNLGGTNPDTLYVADVTNGLLKFSYSGGSWQSKGSVNNGGLTGLTGVISGTTGEVVLYATAQDGSALYSFVDTSGYNNTITGTFTTLASAANKTAFRGVAFAPTQPTLPAITDQAPNQTINYNQSTTLTVTATGAAQLRYQWYQGAASDTSNPVSGATSASFTTPALVTDTTYWVRVTNSGGSADSQTITVTVSQPPTITGQPQSQTINYGQTASLVVTATSTLPLFYQWYQGARGVTTNPVTGETNATFTTPALFTDTTYWVQITNTAGSVNSQAATITVNQPPVITGQPQSQAIVSGTTATLVVTATGTAPLLYQWYQGVATDTSNPIAGATSASYTTPVLTSTTSYWVSITNTVGITNSDTATVTVNYVPTITGQPQDQTILSGTTATLVVTATGTIPLSYQWYKGTASDTSNPVSGATSATFTTPVLTTTTSYWVRVSNVAGQADSRTAVITVNALPVITGQPQDQTIVSGTTATLVVTATGTAPLSYQWYQGVVSDTSNPVSGATSATFTTPVLTTTTQYWVRVSNVAGQADSRTATVTVNYVPTITGEPQDQTILSGNTATLVVTATGTTPLSYQWYKGTAPNTSNPVAGATSATFNTPVLTTTTSYWVSVTNVAGGATSRTAVITVNVPAAITGQPQDQSIATGNTATLVVTATGTVPLSYQWYRGSSGDTSSPISGATSATYTTPILFASTTYWVRVTNVAGQADSRTVTVTVNYPPTITTQPQDQTIIQGQTATLSVVATGTTPISYQWYKGASGNTASPISGATSATYTTPALNVTTQYWVRANNLLGNADSNTVTVTVNYSPTITTQPQDQTIVQGNTATLSVVVSGTSPFYYQWYTGTTGVTTQPISGATSATFTSPALLTSTTYWVAITNVVTGASSRTAVITVNVPVALTGYSPNQTIDLGQSATLTTTASGTTPYSYQWYQGITGVTTNPILGATSSSLTITPSVTSTYWVSVTNVVTTVKTPTIVVTVNQPPSIATQPQDQTIDISQTATLVVTATSTLSLTYQWYQGAAPSTSNPITGATSNSFTTPALYTNTTYWVQVSNRVGPVNSRTLTVTVNQPPKISSIKVTPSSQSIQGGSYAVLTATVSGLAPISYQWYQGLTGDTSNPVALALSNVFTTPNLNSTTSYWVSATNRLGTDQSSAVTITVTNAPSIITQPRSQTIQSGQSVELDVAATGTAPLGYQWYKGSSGNTTNPISGAITNTYFTPALTTTTTYWVLITNTSGSVNSNSAIITVTSLPAITTQPADSVINYGQKASLIVTATGTAPLSYQWYQGVAGNTAISITGATSSVYTTTAMTTTTSYWVRVSNGSGSADSRTATVFINQPPSITALTPQFSGVISDPTNWSVNFSVNDLETSPANLTVTVATSNSQVAPLSSIVVTGTDVSRYLQVNPVGVGYANITVTVTDAGNLAVSQVFNYAASAASATPSTSRYFVGMGGTGAAVAVDSSYMLTGGSDDNPLRLYRRDTSGLPLISFDFGPSLNLSTTGSSSVEIAAAARSGSRVYWLGSHANGTDGSAQPNHNRVFATDLNNSGADTTLDFVAHYDNLRDDLVSWDISNSNRLGLNGSTATGVSPVSSDGSGFAIGGFELAPGNSAGYVALRAPLVMTATTAVSRTMAVIVPVTNWTSLFTANFTGTAQFGDPILLDLGGRTIQDIRKNTSNQYFVLAGPPGSATGTAPSNFRLYIWDGNSNDAPVLYSSDLSLANTPNNGSFEALVDVPEFPNSTSQLQFLLNNTDTVWYNDGQSDNTLTTANFKKFRSELVQLGTGVSGDCVPYNVTTSSDTGECGSLRYALTTANAATQTVTITLAIASASLDVQTPLPVISNTNGFTITVNACSNGSQPNLILQGSSTVTTGLRIGSRVNLSGARITGFGSYGIEVLGSYNTFSCNWIGLNPNNTTASPNAGGIHLAAGAAYNTIGTTSLGNVIAGNSGPGIWVEGGPGNQANSNLIGYNNTGAIRLPNTGPAILISNGGQLKLGSYNRINQRS